MPLGKIRIVPWLTVDEWREVYDQAYSGDRSSQIEAIKRIEIWKERNMHCPPAVLLTGSILSSLIKDKAFYPDVETLDDKELQVIYSTYIMRFLNLVLEDKYEKSSDSLFSRGKKAGIPDWIVDLRHRAAHSHRLPSLDLTHNAISWILNYLKDKYWEIEKNTMKPYAPEKPKVVVLEEKIRGLMDIYIVLSEQSVKTVKKIRFISDTKVRSKILTYINYIPDIFDAETLIKEEVKTIDKASEIKKFKKLNVPEAIVEILKHLKSYLKWPYSYYSPIKFIIRRIIDHAEKHGVVQFDLWSPVIKILYTSDSFPDFTLRLTVDAFMDEKFTYRGTFCAKLLIYVLEALVKREKTEKLKKDLSKNSNELKSIKRINSNMTASEQKILEKLLLRKNLNVDNKVLKTKLAVYATLTARIEKKHPTLRKSLRLIDYKPLRDNDLIKILKIICENPNDQANRCVELIFQLFDKELVQEKEDIMRLLKVFHGEGVSIKKINKIYTLRSLMKESNEEEMLAIDDETPKMDRTLNEEDEDINELPERCPIHDDRANCPWRTVAHYNWDKCPANSLPWKESNIQGPYDVLPYTGKPEHEIKFFKFKSNHKSDFFLSKVEWNKSEENMNID